MVLEIVEMVRMKLTVLVSKRCKLCVSVCLYVCLSACQPVCLHGPSGPIRCMSGPISCYQQLQLCLLTSGLRADTVFPCCSEECHTHRHNRKEKTSTTFFVCRFILLSVGLSFCLQVLSLYLSYCTILNGLDQRLAYVNNRHTIVLYLACQPYHSTFTKCCQCYNQTAEIRKIGGVVLSSLAYMGRPGSIVTSDFLTNRI